MATESNPIVALQHSPTNCPPDRRNEFSNYEYASAESIIRAGRATLSSRNMALVRTGVELAATASPAMMIVTSTWSLVGGKEPTTLTTQFPAIERKGTPLDKAVAAALTSSLAYCLRDLLLIDRSMGATMDEQDDSGHGSASCESRETHRTTPPQVAHRTTTPPPSTTANHTPPTNPPPTTSAPMAPKAGVTQAPVAPVGENAEMIWTTTGDGSKKSGTTKAGKPYNRYFGSVEIDGNIVKVTTFDDTAGEGLFITNASWQGVCRWEEYQGRRSLRIDRGQPFDPMMAAPTYGHQAPVEDEIPF